MNKISLDKLCEFTLNTYNTYDQFNIKDKDYNVSEQISLIKQNFSLNEKGLSSKYNYIELSSLIPKITNDQLVLLYPISFNVKDCYEWYYLLNSLLIVLNPEYLYKNNVMKKLTLETFDKTYRKKVNISEALSDELIEKICQLTKITLIVLTEKTKKIYCETKNYEKVIVLVKIGKEFYPILNWTDRYFNPTDGFIQYLMNFEFKSENKNTDNVQGKNLISNLVSNLVSNLDQNFDEDIKNDHNVDKSDKAEKKVKKNRSKVKINEENQMKESKESKESTESKESKESNEMYQELNATEVPNDHNTIFMSEAAELKKNSILSQSKSVQSKNEDSAKGDETKKKSKKNSKDIFVTNEKPKDKTEDSDSVFNPTEKKISSKDIKKIKENLKTTSTLGELQEYALKLSIQIVEGSTKTGKPKNKTKQELYDSIKQFIDKFEKNN